MPQPNLKPHPILNLEGCLVEGGAHILEVHILEVHIKEVAVYFGWCAHVLLIQCSGCELQNIALLEKGGYVLLVTGSGTSLRHDRIWRNPTRQ